MRIGNLDTYLLLETFLLEGGCPVLRVEAVSSGPRRKFVATHERVVMDSGAAVAQRLTDFAELRSDRFETALSEGGWLRFQRKALGAIVVRYRIGGVAVSMLAAMEGEVLVDGEFSNGFCQEFGALLESL